MFRRVAAHRVEINGRIINRCVVEVDEGRVVNYYTFTDELPLTEWFGGTIIVAPDEDGILSAEWNGKKIE